MQILQFELTFSNINNLNKQESMTNMNFRHIKTEGSQIWNDQSFQPSITCISSARKAKHLNQTPLRFADIALQKKEREADSKSTNDREESQRSQFSKKRFNNEISQAIDVLKQLSSGNEYEQVGDHSHKIRPFQLVAEQDLFQEELSFKGVTNRHNLLQKIDQMEGKINQITQTIYSLHSNRHLDYISKRLSQEPKIKNKNMRQLFCEFYTHLEAIIKEVNDFSIELTRCRSIVKLTKGISHKTMQLYVSRFDTLTSEMGSKLKFLNHYVSMLEAIYKQQTNKNTKKITLSAIHIS